MLVFIDESGCSGFKLNRGSEQIFAVAMVVLNDSAAARTTTAAIERAREATGHKTEFKFSKCNDATRDAYFGAISRAPFRVRAIVVDKARIYSTHLRTDSEHFYSYFVKLLGAHDGRRLVEARVRIDGRGDREFRRAISSYLRRELGPTKIADLRMVDSKSDPLIQLADMCVGAVARAHRGDSRDNAGRWLAMLRAGGRIENIWPFGVP
jgi:hypothetical protein